MFHIDLTYNWRRARLPLAAGLVLLSVSYGTWVLHTIPALAIWPLVLLGAIGILVGLFRLALADLVERRGF